MYVVINLKEPRQAELLLLALKMSSMQMDLMIVNGLNNLALIAENNFGKGLILDFPGNSLD
jgi:hypothetical protein